MFVDYTISTGIINAPEHPNFFYGKIKQCSKLFLETNTCIRYLFNRDVGYPVTNFVPSLSFSSPRYMNSTHDQISFLTIALLIHQSII